MISLDLKQQKRIAQYLLDKKLTLDLAAEVFDHMTTQVSQLMEEQSFEEAWRKTQQLWQKDLKTVYKPWRSLDDTTPLALKNRNLSQWQIFLKSAIKALPFVILILLILRWIPENLVIWFQGLFVILYVLSIVYLFRRFKTVGKIQDRFWNNPISKFAVNRRTPYALLGIIAWFAMPTYWSDLHQFLTTGDFSFFKWTTALMIFVIWFFFVALFMLLKMEDRTRMILKRIQPFLEVLK